MTVKTAYEKYFSEMAAFSKAPAVIDETNVYQPANEKLAKYMDIILGDAFLPNSHLEGVEYFKEFYDAVASGKKGLLLVEHYTNLDLPGIIYLLRKLGTPWAVDFASKIVAIAGMKLNEASPFVRIWTEGFSRVVIYPTRSLVKAEDKAQSDEQKLAEAQKARKINFAAMRAMDKICKEGKIILVFPSGTRYRPGNPDTKRGLREIDSYVRLFDVALPVAINGSALTINPDTPDDMLSDKLNPTNVIMKASKMLQCKEFRKDIVKNITPGNDEKQAVVDKIMTILEDTHKSTLSQN